MGTTATKGMVKTLTVIAAIAAFFIAQSSFAIEGLKLSVQCTNAILTWPCLDDGSEQFIVQYRSTLSTTDSWQTLETSLPAVYGTNQMWYTNYGVVLNPVNCDGGGGMEGMAMMGGGGMSLSASQPAIPMATPNSGGDSAPVKIFPTGFDFSNFTISIPGISGSLSGMQFMQAQADDETNGPPDPTGGGASGDGDTNSVPPEVGFYRVVRNGAHMIGVTNGTVWSGTVTVPLEVGDAYGTLDSISINDNDASVAVGNSTQFGPFNSPLVAVVDTTRMSNGVYNISAYANWNDGNGGEWDASSPAIAVTVSNEISFENWMPEFGETGNSLLFRATSAHTNVNWNVDVYDSSNNYVGSFAGHTPDGDISFTWDLVDGNGVAHTNDAFFNFEISTPYIDPPAPPTYRKNDPWLGKGAWCEVCQHAFDDVVDSETIYQELNQFVSQAGGNGSIKPTPNSGDGSPYVLNYGSDNPQGDTDWNNFRTALYDPYTRNLVYFGHGAPNGLGANTNGAVRFISASEIASHLHTIPDGQNGRHTFRFVFVDGCDTGNAKMAQAFGIRTTENVPDLDYYDASLRPSCYVGWPDTKWIDAKNLGGGPNYDHINFIKDIQHTMLFYTQTIHVAVVQSGGANGGLFLHNNMKIFGSWNVTMSSNNE